MKLIIDNLMRIERQINEIEEAIMYESRVHQAELEERQRLGLHGDAAVKHYNEWMQRYGMTHLMVEED